MTDEINLKLEDGDEITIGKLGEEDWDIVRRETGFDVDEYVEELIGSRNDWEFYMGIVEPLSPDVRLQIFYQAFKKEDPEVTKEQVDHITSFGLRGSMGGLLLGEEEFKALLQILKDKLDEKARKKIKATFTLAAFRF